MRSLINHISRVRSLINSAMARYVRIVRKGSPASVLCGTSAMVNISTRKEGHSLDLVAQRALFGAKSTKSGFEAAAVHRNVDYRVSATQFGGKGPKRVQLTACGLSHIDQ